MGRVFLYLNTERGVKGNMIYGYPFVYDDKASELFDCSLVFLDENYTNRPSGAEKKLITDSVVRTARKIYLDTTQEEVLEFGIEIVFNEPGDIHKLTALKRWLTSPLGYTQLRICAENFESYYFNCVIHLNEDLIFNGGYRGVSATVECDAPWAWQDELTTTFNLEPWELNTVHFSNVSDDAEPMRPIITIHTAEPGPVVIQLSRRTTNFYSITGVSNSTHFTKQEAIRYCKLNNIPISKISKGVFIDSTRFQDLQEDDIITCDCQTGIITAEKTPNIVQHFGFKGDSTSKRFLKIPQGYNNFVIMGVADRISLSYTNAKKLGGGYY